MDGRSGLSALAPSAGRRLEVLDRLHALMCERLRRRPSLDDEAVLRSVFEHHVRELRGMAAQDASPSRSGLDVDALCAMARERREGSPLTPDYLSALARRIPDFDPPFPDPGAAAASVSGAASAEAHPVVRATQVFLTTARALRPEVPAQHTGAPGPPPHLRPLPWALASLALMRAGHPPLVADRRLGPAFDAAVAALIPEDDVADLVADLQIAALRSVLSSAPARPGVEYTVSDSLAGAVHRRVDEHLRQRRGPIALVLREIEPGSRVDVFSDTGPGGGAARCAEAASRALFTPGPGCRRSVLRLTAGDAEADLQVAVQDVGAPPTGVLAVTADARVQAHQTRSEILPGDPTYCVTLVPGDSADARRPDVERFVDDAVSRVVDRLTRTLA